MALLLLLVQVLVLWVAESEVRVGQATGMSHSLDSSMIPTLFPPGTTLDPPCVQVVPVVAIQTPVELHPHQVVWLEELGELFPEPFPFLPLVEVAEPAEE